MIILVFEKKPAYNFSFTERSNFCILIDGSSLRHYGGDRIAVITGSGRCFI